MNKMKIRAVTCICSCLYLFLWLTAFVFPLMDSYHFCSCEHLVFPTGNNKSFPVSLCPQRLLAQAQWTHCMWIKQLEYICRTAAPRPCGKKRVALCMSAMFVGVYSWAELCLTFVPDRSVWAWWYFGMRSQQRQDARQRCEEGRDGKAYDWYSH